MPKDDVCFNCVEVTQPIGTFYVGSVAAEDILAIAYADIRRIEDRDIERIVGIQRELVPRRVRELREYVANVDATFPTSVILAVSSEHARYDETRRVMSIRRDKKVAKIIDGQHRIAGLEGVNGVFELNVTIFVDMDIEDQAMTFAVINLSQTKVNKSLAYDLYEFQKHRSPAKTCHNIAKVLNSEGQSPLANRIKILGKATGEEFQFITQATFVEALISYISDNPMRDRDLLKRGKPVPVVDDERLVFRPAFRDNKDELIADVIWNYFQAVAQRWPDAWNSGERGDILNRTQGFRAFMRLLQYVYSAAGSNQRLSAKKAGEVLGRIKLRNTDFTVQRYSPGTSGESKLFRELLEQTGLG